MRIFTGTREIKGTVRDREHGGTGVLTFRRLLTSTDFASAIDFVDYTSIPPGSTIGLHRHDGNEELYLIVSGTPVVRVETTVRRLQKGDVAVVRSGESHELENDTQHDVEMFVVQVHHNQVSSSE